MGEALAAWVNVDADPLPQNKLHVSRVAELDHHADRQVDALLWPRPPATKLGTLMDSGVP